MTDAKRNAIYAAACLGLISFSAAMVFTASGEPRTLPWYEPLEHRWIRAQHAPTTVAMDYYARVGLSFGLAIVAAGITLAIAARRTLSTTVVRAVGVWAWALTLLAMFLYGHALLTRHIEPPPTPPTRGIR